MFYLIINDIIHITDMFQVIILDNIITSFIIMTIMKAVTVTVIYYVFDIIYDIICDIIHDIKYDILKTNIIQNVTTTYRISCVIIQ